MSKIEVNLSEPAADRKNQGIREKPVLFASIQPRSSGKSRRVLKVLGLIALCAVIVLLVGGLIYWRNLRDSPQFALALLVDASRRGDQAKIDELVDTDAIIDDFLPQITGQAAELYGRGLPAEKIGKIAQLIAPVIPAVKERARAELPGIIRQKTRKFENVPYWAIAAAAGFYLDISNTGDEAVIKSPDPERPLELTLRRVGGNWRVVAVKDDALARSIAERFGQEIVAIVRNRSLKELDEAAKKVGIDDLLKVFGQAKDILNR